MKRLGAILILLSAGLLAGCQAHRRLDKSQRGQAGRAGY